MKKGRHNEMKTTEKIVNAMVNGYKKIENGVVTGYKKIETGTVNGYKKIEKGAVDGFNSVCDKIIKIFFTKDGESVEDTKKRLSKSK